VKLKIKIGEKEYEVEVEASEPEPEPLPSIAFSLQSTAVQVVSGPAAGGAGAGESVDEEKVCRSPINGVVVRVVAQVGQSIQTGDTMLVLEAMKMETNITAPRDGKVGRIRVEPGKGVTAGQILVDFE
jgi:methylmalonyl-CoA carboxyltransferase small subunit